MIQKRIPHLWVELGRFGDIINLFPLLQEEFRQGRRITLMVAKEFASVMECISYADVLVWDGAHDDLEKAVAYARRFNPQPRVAQIWGKGYTHTRTFEHFQRDSYHRLGMGHRWEQLTPLIDRRNFEREAGLQAGIDWSRPTIVYNGSGHSSPFPGREKFFIDLNLELGHEFQLIDISQLRAFRIFDVLGLIDRAHVFITCDTSLMHLAQATSTPVIAFVSSDFWLAGAKRANHLLHLKYRDVNVERVAAAARTTLTGVGKIAHAYPWYPLRGEDARRQAVAQQSWDAEYAEGSWIPVPVENTKRNSRDALGDVRPCPFVRDVIEAGFAKLKGTNPRDCVVLTNTDVGFTPGLIQRIHKLVGAKGSAYAYRFEFNHKLSTPMDYHQTVSGHFSGGLDLFVLTRAWWDQFNYLIPDLVMGRSDWDLLFRDMLKMTGGGELYGSHFHENHPSPWQVEKQCAGNVHNQKVRGQWNSHNDTCRPFANMLQFSYESKQTKTPRDLNGHRAAKRHAR